MLSKNKVITIIFVTVIAGCSPGNLGQNFSPFNFLQSKSDILNNTLIVPGKSVGAVTAKTTRADLVKIFGESKLKDDVVLEDEGTISVPVTKVNLGGEKYFTVAWEEDTRETLLYVRDFGSAWKTPEGIGIGTSLQELQKKLGDFKLTGLGWNYGGFINLETTTLSARSGLRNTVSSSSFLQNSKPPPTMVSVSLDETTFQAQKSKLHQYEDVINNQIEEAERRKQQQEDEIRNNFLHQPCQYTKLSQLSLPQLQPDIDQYEESAQRHMVTPPKGGKLNLVCCHTT